MRQKATTVLGWLLVLWGLVSAFIPSPTWTIYTPYSSLTTNSGTIFGAETMSGILSRLSMTSSWTFLLIGSVLVTLMQAPRRIAIVAILLDGLAVAVHSAPMIYFISHPPRRYHYYYFVPESQIALTSITLILLLVPIVGLLMSVAPGFIRRFSKSPPVYN